MAGYSPMAKICTLPLTSKLGLTVVRSRSRENNTQLFSNTLAPLRYALCTAYVNRTLLHLWFAELFQNWGFAPPKQKGHSQESAGYSRRA